MKILFLNCDNRRNGQYVIDYVKNNNIDIAILTESKNIRNAMADLFEYSFVSDYKYGLTIASNMPFKSKNIDYLIYDERLRARICNDNYRERVIATEFDNLHIISAHVDYGFYNPFAMDAIDDYINKNDVDIILGSFNSGYINDNLDYQNGGLVFQNGYRYFSKYEQKGFIDPNKDKQMYSFISVRSKRKFRLDHCFIKNIKANVSYVNEFLTLNISDHKGILVEI